MKKPSFEDCIDKINHEINKRRNSWTLTALAWLDFSDVAQILRIHINNKWHLYDPSKPLLPWINTIISHQIKNLIRNNYGNYSRPCLRCAAAEGGDLCRIYERQCERCPLYSDWAHNKKHAYDIKLPLSIENHTKEIYSASEHHIDIDKAISNLHNFMQANLKPIELKVYKYLYIEHKEEADVAKLMGYKTSEKGRNPGYKQIKNIKKIIIAKAKKALTDGDVDIM